MFECKIFFFYRIVGGEVLSKMVVYFDIDKVIVKNDFYIFLKENFSWPWSSTHFILSETCFDCGGSTQSTFNASPSHFILIMNRDDVKYLIKSNWFWCKTCEYVSVYDHYPDDECDSCNK